MFRNFTIYSSVTLSTVHIRPLTIVTDDTEEFFFQYHRVVFVHDLLLLQFFSGYLWLAQGGPTREDLGQCKCVYSHLKNVWISGFKAARGQLEFLLHVIENADALEVLRVEIGEYPPNNYRRYAGGGPPVEEAKQIARATISTILPQRVTFHIV